MNITHAEKEVVNGDGLQAIFERQKELMSKYHDIELKSGLLQTEDCPVNLDDKRGQARIKDFSWRVTEELGEALDAADDNSHFTEELIDGLHFLTELSILAGIEAEDLVQRVIEQERVKESVSFEKVDFTDNVSILHYIGHSLGNGARPSETLNYCIRNFIENIGMMCNCLKNKPWKQSNMVTDKEAFYDKLSLVWVWYFAILSKVMNPSEIIDTYLRKSQVNKFRQRSNY